MSVESTETEAPASAPGGTGFYRPKGRGFWGLGPVGTAIAAAGAFATILSMLSAAPLLGPLAVLSTTVLFLMLAAWPDRHGKTTLQRLGRRLGHRSAKRHGSTLYTPGTLTHLGSHKLPGVLASSELHDWTDADGNSFAVLRYPRTHSYVVSAAAQPDGASLLDDLDIERQIGNYDHYLAALSHEPDFEQLIVTIETAPESGPLMTQAVRSRESERAHPLSKQVMTDVLEQYPTGSQGVRATVTATFGAPPPETALDGSRVKRRDRLDEAEQVGRLLAIRLPHLFADLPDAGAGAVTPLTADDLIERVRVAFNPADQEAYDQARAEGKARPVTLWSNAGPAGATEHWNWYQHGGAGSVTWEFTGFTTSRVQANALLPLLESGTLGCVTRISIIYQPVDPGRASHIVESNFNAAQSRLLDARKPTARQRKAVRDADRARRSEADGHALMDFAILVTTTVENPEQALAKARAAVGRLGSNARLNLRSANGLQASAFAQGIGVLGLITDKHLKLPRALMNGI